MKESLAVVDLGLKFPKGVDTLTGIILPDAHAAPDNDTEGGVDPVAWECFLKAIEVVKPDFLINIGDFGEWSSVNSYQWAKKKRPPIRYTTDELSIEYEAVNKYMDMVDRALPKSCQKFFIEGNHELWIDNLFAESPDLDPRISVKRGLDLDRRGYKYFEHGKWVKVGKLYLNHGTSAKGVNHTRQMLIRHGKNIMYGHIHDLQKATIATLGGALSAWSVGFLGMREKPFLRGDTTNWEHGFCLLHVHKSGFFSVEQISIVNGTCWTYGRKIKNG